MFVTRQVMEGKTGERAKKTGEGGGNMGRGKGEQGGKMCLFVVMVYVFSQF